MRLEKGEAREGWRKGVSFAYVDIFERQSEIRRSLFIIVIKRFNYTRKIWILSPQLQSVAVCTRLVHILITSRGRINK